MKLTPAIVGLVLMVAAMGLCSDLPEYDYTPPTQCDTRDCAKSLCSEEVVKDYLRTYSGQTEQCMAFLSVAMTTDSLEKLAYVPGYYNATDTAPQSKADFYNFPNYIPISIAQANLTVHVCPCCKGYYCPAKLTCAIPCSEGGHCPYPYPSSFDSSTNNALTEHAGAYWDTPCSEGNYCPTTDGEEIVCPEHYFCPSGVVKPIKCSILAICTKGSKRPILPLSSLLVLIVLGAIFLVAKGSYHLLRDRRRKKREMEREKLVKLKKYKKQMKMLLHEVNIKKEFEARTLPRDIEENMKSPAFIISSEGQNMVNMQDAFTYWKRYTEKLRYERIKAAELDDEGKWVGSPIDSLFMTMDDDYYTSVGTAVDTPDKQGESTALEALPEAEVLPAIGVDDAVNPAGPPTHKRRGTKISNMLRIFQHRGSKAMNGDDKRDSLMNADEMAFRDRAPTHASEHSYYDEPRMSVSSRRSTRTGDKETDGFEMNDYTKPADVNDDEPSTPQYPNPVGFGLGDSEPSRSRAASRRSRADTTATAITEVNQAPKKEAAPFKGLHEKRFRVDIRFENLGLVLKKGKKRVLDGVTGGFRSGRLTAIMGPSGAGKTTLLNTVMGKAFYGKSTGKIFINGKEGNLSRVRRLTGFVPQDDIMHSELTLKENLQYIARLTLPPNMDSKVKRQIVRDVLTILGLQRIRHSIVGDADKRGVSGGQRKRANIGFELVQDPTLLFLDEPTSGLDSTSSHATLLALQKVCRMGLTVAAVIHQPRYEIFRLFDDALLLGEGGRTVYMGPTAGALEYFASIGFDCPPLVNPADFLMDVIAGEVPRKNDPKFHKFDLFKFWEESDLAKSQLKNDFATYESCPNSLETVEKIYGSNRNITFAGAISKMYVNSNEEKKLMKPRRPSFFWQALVALRRETVLHMRTFNSIILDVFLTALLAALFGIMYPSPGVTQSITYNALVTLLLSITGMVSSLRVFGNDRLITWREASSGVNRLSVFTAKNIAALPMIMVMPLVFVTVNRTFSTHRKSWSDMYGVLVLQQWAATGVGYCISMVTSPVNSQMAAVVMNMGFVIFNGSFVTLKNLEEMVAGPCWVFLSLFSLFRHSMNALLYVGAIAHTPVFDNTWDTIFRRTGYLPGSDGYVVSLCSLVGLGVAFRVLAFFLMVFTNRNKQR